MKQGKSAPPPPPPSAGVMKRPQINKMFLFLLSANNTKWEKALISFLSFPLPSLNGEEPWRSRRPADKHRNWIVMIRCCSLEKRYPSTLTHSHSFSRVPPSTSEYSTSTCSAVLSDTDTEYLTKQLHVIELFQLFNIFTGVLFSSSRESACLEHGATVTSFTALYCLHIPLLSVLWHWLAFYTRTRSSAGRVNGDVK